MIPWFMTVHTLGSCTNANDNYDATNNNSRKGIQIQQVSANGDVGFLSKKSAGSDGYDYAGW